MKTRWLLCSTLLVGIPLFGGCGDNGAPTEPTVGGLNLTGAWTGTITHSDSGCGREGIAGALAQQGTTLTGSFPTMCQGMLELRGAMNGESLVGELSRTVDGVRIGEISGTVSQTSIRITTSQSQPRERHEPPSRLVLNVIELMR